MNSMVAEFRIEFKFFSSNLTHADGIHPEIPANRESTSRLARENAT